MGPDSCGRFASVRQFDAVEGGRFYLIDGRGVPVVCYECRPVKGDVRQYPPVPVTMPHEHAAFFDHASIAALRTSLTAAEAERAKEIGYLNDVLHRKNVELDALHFVWCTGSCGTGVHRFDHGELTEAIVVEAERNTKRLRTRWTNTAARAAPEREQR